MLLDFRNVFLQRTYGLVDFGDILLQRAEIGLTFLPQGIEARPKILPQILDLIPQLPETALEAL